MMGRHSGMIDSDPFQVGILTIPHSKQSYLTSGDYWWDGNTLHMRISKIGDLYSEAAIALHEFGEAILCRKFGVADKEIDAFDHEFEAARLTRADDKSGFDFRGRWIEDPEAEPGDQPEAPYFKFHQFMMGIERLFVAQLGMDWEKHDGAIGALFTQEVSHEPRADDPIPEGERS